jgi:arsenate reductase
MKGATRRVKVLFLCTGNSCRSQMAEDWARELLGDGIEAYSAGIEAHGLNPRAVRVMAEASVDIREQRSQRTIHRSFRDPARAEGSEEEKLAVFRSVRDEIRTFVEGLPAVLAGGS